MKIRLLLPLAFLLFAAFECPDDPNRPPPPPTPYPTVTPYQPPPQPTYDPGRGDGPVSNTSGPSENYGVTSRHPGENAHDYKEQGQGRRGPCGVMWDNFEYYRAAYREGRVSQSYVDNALRTYSVCVEQNYPY